jgi:hypothetical protein
LLIKAYWSKKQGYSVSPWQGAICGSVAGGIAASITTPLGLMFIILNSKFIFKFRCCQNKNNACQCKYSNFSFINKYIFLA